MPNLKRGFYIGEGWVAAGFSLQGGAEKMGKIS